VQRPALKEFTPMLTSVFGKVEEMSFTLVHVLLTALLLAVLMSQAERSGTYEEVRRERYTREKTE